MKAIANEARHILLVALIEKFRLARGMQLFQYETVIYRRYTFCARCINDLCMRQSCKAFLRFDLNMARSRCS